MLLAMGFGDQNLNTRIFNEIWAHGSASPSGLKRPCFNREQSDYTGIRRHLIQDQFQVGGIFCFAELTTNVSAVVTSMMLVIRRDAEKLPVKS